MGEALSEALTGTGSGQEPSEARPAYREHAPGTAVARMEIRLPWDEPKYYKFANGEFNTYRKRHVALPHGLNLRSATTHELPEEIVFEFDEKQITHLILANRFCKLFELRSADLPEPIKRFRSYRWWWARTVWALRMVLFRSRHWADIRTDIREVCETYGLAVMQMALANPPGMTGNPYLASLIRQAEPQVRAWIMEQVYKQHRHERKVFLIELAILVFVAIEVWDKISIAANWVWRLLGIW